ncbi:hypothetical protein D3C76_1140830 [compost metagenome]
MGDGLQMTRAQVRAEKALGIGAHLLEVAAVAQCAEVDAQIAERSDHRNAQAQQQCQVDQAIHASLQRSRRLS